MAKAMPTPVKLSEHREIAQLQRKIAQLQSEVAAVDNFAKTALASVHAVAHEVHELTAEVRASVATLTGSQDRILSALSALHEKVDNANAMNEQRDRALAFAADNASTKASGARRLGVALEARISRAEARDLEFEARMSTAKAEGEAIADRREARRQLIRTWTSLPIALALIGLLARACFGS